MLPLPLPLPLVLCPACAGRSVGMPYAFSRMSDSVMREGILGRADGEVEDADGDVDNGGGLLLLEEDEERGGRRRLGQGGIAWCWWRGKH